jgi:hypothetical protein
MSVQFHVDAFDLLNHPNYGQPGPVRGGASSLLFTPGSSTFSTISSTRFPTGDSGSSRQLQFALKFLF